MHTVQGTEDAEAMRLMTAAFSCVPWTLGTSVPPVSTCGAHFPFATTAFITCFFTAGLLYPTSSMYATPALYFTDLLS